MTSGWRRLSGAYGNTPPPPPPSAQHTAIPVSHLLHHQCSPQQPSSTSSAQHMATPDSDLVSAAHGKPRLPFTSAAHGVPRTAIRASRSSAAQHKAPERSTHLPSPQHTLSLRSTQPLSAGDGSSVQHACPEGPLVARTAQCHGVCNGRESHTLMRQDAAGVLPGP